MNIAKLSEQLKDVPQAKLVQYAQDPAGVVPQFLALAEIQRRKKLEAMNPAQPPQSTVAQDIMAQAMQPPAGIGMPMPRTGVAALPSNMGEQSFAGGGIVAFAGDEDSLVKEDKNWFERLRDSFYSPSEVYLSDIMRGKKATPPEGPPLSAANIEAMRQGKAPMTPTKEQQDEFAREKARMESTSNANKRAIAAGELDVKPKKDTPPPANKGEKVLAPAAESKDPQKKLFEEYEKMLMAQGEDAKKAREEAKYMRILEAGLGIMGGTSPYAMANIGAGATGALKGYAQDLAGMRKEERERAKELAGIGAKREEFAIDREKLAMMERRYKEMADLERQKIGAMYGGREDEKFITQVNRVYQTDMSAIKNQLGRELTDEELNNIYRNAYNRVASVAGKGSMAGTPAAASTTIPWDQLGKKATK